jgi:diacylglycerol kinase (ATP)
LNKMQTGSYARVIVNPSAGAGRTARRWPRIMGQLKSLGIPFDHDLSQACGHAVELAASAAGKGYRLVIAVGGDGTINEIVNGINQAGSLKEITLGIIHTGSGSDFIRSIGVPRDYKEACSRLVSPKRLRVDLGVAEFMVNQQATKRLFVNFAGLGFDAEVVKATTQGFKALGSTPSYLLGVLNALLLYWNKDIFLMLDGEPEERRVCTVIMSNGRYGAGGMFLAPDADPSDGLLDVLTVGDLNKADLLWSLPRIYKGTHLTHPKVTMRRAREIKIRSREPMLVQADGELIGAAPARFSILPGALSIVV